MTLTATALGDRMAQAPDAVATLHATHAPRTGEITVELSSNPLVAFLLRCFGFPKPVVDHPFRFERRVAGQREEWRRGIGAHVLVSQLWLCGPDQRWIGERMGPVTVLSEPQVDPDSLRLRPRAIRMFGVPVPKPLWPRIETREYQGGDRYGFDIKAKLPVLGSPLFRYHGWLDVTPLARSDPD